MTTRGTKRRVRELQRRRANQRMRTEVAPFLSSPPAGRLNGWNPLRLDDFSDYGLEISPAQCGVKAMTEILRSDDLMKRVRRITVETAHGAALDEPKAFVTDLLTSLMDDERR